MILISCIITRCQSSFYYYIRRTGAESLEKLKFWRPTFSEDFVDMGVKIRGRLS
jgi:hypothetical protein